MKYEERRPLSGQLAPYVKCIWTLQRSYSGNDAGEVLWPDGCKEIIFHYGVTFRRHGEPLPVSFVMGTLSGYCRLHGQGDLLLYGIRLYPWGLFALTDQPVKLFNDRFLPAGLLFPPCSAAGLAKLEQSLSTTTDLARAQPLIESFLLPRIIAHRFDDRLIAALKQLCDTPESHDVLSAARAAGLSLRQLERQCVRLTGLSPKRLHRISRFNQVRMRLLSRPDTNLLDCMAEAGYYDYSHFSKDFKRCLGLTPHQFKAWVENMIVQAGPEHVEFLQDKPQPRLV